MLALLTGTVSTYDANLYTSELKASTVARYERDAARIAAEMTKGQGITKSYGSKAADAFMREERGRESDDSSQVGRDQGITVLIYGACLVNRLFLDLCVDLVTLIQDFGAQRGVSDRSQVLFHG